MVKQNNSNKAFERLYAYLQKAVDITPAEFEFCSTLFAYKRLKKNEFILRNGEVSNFGIFVTDGCLRLYNVDEKGEEHIIQFAIDDWWISDISSMLSGKPSIYNIDAIEDSDVLLIDKPSFEKYLAYSPKFEKNFNFSSQKSRAVLQDRMTTFLAMPAEERYLYMLNNHPAIIQRVPQRHIASFLGITPESLSRIRKKLSLKSYKQS